MDLKMLYLHQMWSILQNSWSNLFQVHSPTAVPVTKVGFPVENFSYKALNKIFCFLRGCCFRQESGPSFQILVNFALMVRARNKNAKQWCMPHHLALSKLLKKCKLFLTLNKTLTDQEFLDLKKGISLSNVVWFSIYLIYFVSITFPYNYVSHQREVTT